MGPDNYVNFPLLGKTLSYTIDLSAVGCSCNAALYWVSMPGYSQDGSLSPSDKGNYYCDANKVWGTWCWEMDSIEANMHTMQVTPHKCSSAAGAYIESCDRSGAGVNSFFHDPRGLCPSDDCKINTTKPFTHIQTFVSDPTGEKLVGIANKLEQNGSVF